MDNKRTGSIVGAGNRMTNKISPDLLTIAHVCPYCFGSGKQRAMQMASTFSGDVARVEDTKVECNACNGKGFIK